MADLLFFPSFSPFLLGGERGGSDGNKSDLERLKPGLQSLGNPDNSICGERY